MIAPSKRRPVEIMCHQLRPVESLANDLVARMSSGPVLGEGCFAAGSGSVGNLKIKICFRGLTAFELSERRVVRIRRKGKPLFTKPLGTFS